MLSDTEKFNRARKRLEEENLDAIFVKLPENVLFFSNYWPITGWGAALILKDEEPILITPESEEKFTSRRTISNMQTYGDYNTSGLIKKLKTLDVAGKKLKVGVEKSFESVSSSHLGYELAIPNNPFFAQLEKKIPSWTLTDAVPIITELRAVKSKLDFENLKLVNEVNNFGLAAGAEAVKEEKTEMEIATIIESTIHNKISDMSDKIDFIRSYAFVMAGPENGSQAGQPYNISSAYKMKKGELCMVELNTQVNGYWSDITRTWAVGRNPTDDQKDMMDTINAGIAAAMKASVPGTTTHDIDAASREVIMATQWGKYHTPFLGHGIGVKLHEPIPMLYPNSPGTVELGNYYTIEPGLYGKEIKGALRIERDVWLSKDGPIATDTFPCEL